MNLPLMATPSKTIPTKSDPVKPAKNGKAKPVPVSTRSEAIKRALPALAAGAGVDVPATAETRLPPLDVGLSARALGRDLGMLSRTTALFARGGVFVTVDAATGDTKLMTVERFCSWIETIVWPCKDGRNGLEKTRLGVDLARVILMATSARLNCCRLATMKQRASSRWIACPTMRTWTRARRKRGYWKACCLAFGGQM